jgi:GntR family transcriptional regulator
MADNQWENLFDENNMLSNDNEIPFYTQILTVIRQHIKSGALKPGDIIPSELELCKMYGVSRTTVRQALDRLAEENLIIRRRGKGSFVANPKLHRNLDHLYSFTEDMKKLNLEPYSEILESIVEETDEETAGALGLKPGAEVYKLSRLRCAGGEPLLLENTFIPLYLCSDIAKEDFSKKSLYETLTTKYMLNMVRAVETYEAVSLNEETAVLLNCTEGEPAFNVHRIGYLEDSTPIEYTSSFVRSDKCIFKVELKTDKRQVHFSREITP